MMQILQIFGALGLFLFGMKYMSEGVQKVSGNRLRSIMETATGNRLSGVLSGAFITGVIQSSSATTVMIVSFVNAGILKLREAIGVIMGANLGTTCTFWIISFLGYKFSMSSISLPVIGLGLVFMFTNKPKLKDLGETFIGFGILFLGLSFLKNSVPDIRSSPETLQFLENWWGMGYTSVFLFIFVGVVLTVIVQSSSAAGAITIALTVEGWIPIEASCAIILGENIGTTITANIAAITGNYTSKCAARAHFIFNVIGVIWMLIVFFPFVSFIESMMPNMMENKSDLATFLAVFHTSFNTLNILFLIGFVPHLEKLAIRLAKNKNKSNEPEAAGYMQGHSLLPFTGELNIAATENEIKRLSELSQEMFSGFKNLLQNPNEDKTELVKELLHLEEVSDELSRGVTHHLVLCSTDQISIDSASRVSCMLLISHELEDICDCCYRLVKQARRRYRKNRDFLDGTELDLIAFAEMIEGALKNIDEYLVRKVDPKQLEASTALENSINVVRSKIRKQSVLRMTDEDSVKVELICINMLNDMEKVGDHALNVMQALCQVEA